MNNRSAALCAVSASASVPLLGPWLPLVAALLYGLHRLFAIISEAYAELLLRESPMVSPTGVERRGTARRNEDKKPLARIKALEEDTKSIKESQAQQRKETAKQGKTLEKAIKTQTQHMVGCETKADKNEADNATIIKTQGQHGVDLVELKETVLPMAEWHAARLKRAEFWARLADKATDKIIERVIWGVLTMLATAIGAAKIAPIVGRLLGP